jgi:lysine-specific histone demethylase 1
LLPQDMFGHVSTDPQLRGLYYLFYTYDSISGGAVLAALVAGDAAVEFEAKPEAQAVGEVMQLLRGIFQPQGVAVPEPLQVGGWRCGLSHCIMLPKCDFQICIVDTLGFNMSARLLEV